MIRRPRRLLHGKRRVPQTWIFTSGAFCCRLKESGGWGRRNAQIVFGCRMPVPFKRAGFGLLLCPKVLAIHSPVSTYKFTMSLTHDMSAELAHEMSALRAQ